MTSSTVKFNIFSLLMAIGLIATAYVAFPGIPQWLYIALSVTTMVVSQLITFFDPSGAFVGHGQNWSSGKWITRVGTALLGTLALVSGSGWAVAAIAVVTPFLEIIIRIYGSDTAAQRNAAAK